MQKEDTPDEYPVLPRHGGPPNYDKREKKEDKRNKDRERRTHADSIDRGKKRDRSPPPPPGKATSSSGGVYGPSDATNRTSSGRSGKCVRFALQSRTHAPYVNATILT